MQDVWKQLLFNQKMDEDGVCCTEADAFLLSIKDCLLRFLSAGKLLTNDEIQELINKHPMNTIAVRADGFSGLKKKRKKLVRKKKNV